MAMKGQERDVVRVFGSVVFVYSSYGWKWESYYYFKS